MLTNLSTSPSNDVLVLWPAIRRVGGAQGFPCACAQPACTCAHFRQIEEPSGPVALQEELWVERCIQLHKGVTAHRVSSEIMRQQLSFELARSKHVQTFDQLDPSYRSQPAGPAYDAGEAGPAYDAGELAACCCTRARLTYGARSAAKLQAKQQARDAALAAAVRALEELGAEDAPGFSREGAWGRPALYRHTQASCGGGSGLYHSRSVRAAAYHVTVQFDGRVFVGRISHFLRVVPAGVNDPQRRPLQLALCSVYRQRTPVGRALRADGDRMAICGPYT